MLAISGLFYSENLYYEKYLISGVIKSLSPTLQIYINDLNKLCSKQSAINGALSYSFRFKDKNNFYIKSILPISI